MKFTIFVIAWLHANDWQAGVDSVKQNAGVICEASPAWYAPTADGGVAALAGVPVDDPALLGIVRANKITLRPIIMNTSKKGFDPKLIGPILDEPAISQKHVEAIVALIAQKKYDGIDLDYESIAPSELPKLADFVELLAVALHRMDKTLAVDLQAKFAGQDPDALRRIGRAADSVRLMVYPEHNAATDPGPIASLGWINQRLKAALADIPAEKLALGMATYAMTWDPDGSGSWEAIAEPAVKNGVKISRDRDGVPSFKDGGKTVYFEDAVSIAKKIEAAQKLGVRNIAFWRLGGEDPAVWKLFKNPRQ